MFANEFFKSIAGPFNDTRMEFLLKNLRKRRFNAYHTENEAAACKLVKSLIPGNSTVSQGGSMTLEQAGIRDMLLKDKSIDFLDPYNEALSPEERMNLRKRTSSVDVFVCSANAITMDGIIVNRDGIGNRVAAMAFGPEKVIIVAGINKIVSNLDDAFTRIQQLSAPLNACRLNRRTPCTQSLKCENCNSEDRICSTTTIMDWHWYPSRMHIIIVQKELGF